MVFSRLIRVRLTNKKPHECGAVNQTIIPTGLTNGLGVDLILLSLSKIAIFKILIRNRNEL